MGANKVEKFETLVISRKDLHKADYNPRKISEAAAKKLSKFLRKNGLWAPLIVNKRTMTLVSGHQRLTAMDALLGDTYELTVAMVDVDEATEAKGNVFMNNPSAQGEWDVTALQDIANIFPELDFEKDLGFDTSDLDVMFGKEFQGKNETLIKDAEAFGTDYFREEKKKQRQTAKEQNEENGSYHLNENDYSVTFVFPNNREKLAFMEKIKKNQKETHLKSTVLWDIWKQVYNLSSI
jgi:hypothetical protein